MFPAGCVERCPACPHREMSAAESATAKHAWLEQALAPWSARLGPMQAAAGEARWGYREQVRLSAAWNGAWSFGLLDGEELVAIPHCPVHSGRVRDTLAALAPALPPGPGFPLAWFVQSGAQATLVVKTREAPEPAWLHHRVRGALEAAGLEGLWLNLHPAAGRRVLGSRGWRLLWGRPRSTDPAGLLYGPASFQQRLPGLHDQALDEAEAFLAPGPGDAVADLCSGVGASLRRWGARGADTLGIELSAEAVDCARHNAPGAVVLQGRCSERLPQITEWAGGAGPGRLLLYANPPRTGLGGPVTDWIARAGRPARLALLSCSAGTLARDLATLEAGGYAVERISPYDFLPQTLHVEALALLART